MEVQTLYVGVPIGALGCYIFLLLASLNMPKVKAVREFRWCIVSAVLWSGTSVLMRMQAEPGMAFWFQFAFLGLMLVPVAVYSFLFEIMEIKKKNLLFLAAGVSVVIFLINCYNESILAPPQIIRRKGDIAGYSYISGTPIKLVVLFELVLMVYVITIAHMYVTKKKKLAKEINITLAGIICVYIGTFLKLLTGNTFPFGSLGGVIMAICITYVMYSCHRFDLHNRVLIGCIYSIAVAFGIYPLWGMSRHVEIVKEYADISYAQLITIVSLAVALWLLALLGIASKIAMRITKGKKATQHNVLHRFQAEIASVFHQEELYQEIMKVLQELYPASEVWIFMRKEITQKYHLVNTNSGEVKLSDDEQKRVREILYSDEIGQYHQIALLKYDKIIWGFIYMKFPKRSHVNYEEIEIYHEIGSYASVCLKNISVYQELYQITIQDELTGVYNRSYFETVMTRKNREKVPYALMLLDIDDFKLYNELYGERVGDAILKWAGKLLYDISETQGEVFRVGSNQFALFAEGKSKEELIKMAQLIQDALKNEKRCRPAVLQAITMSIGIASCPEDAKTAGELKKCAQKAVDYSKNHGKNRIIVAGEEENDEENKIDYEKIAPTVYALAAAIDAKDAYTFAHSQKVSEYAAILASELGLSKNDVELVKEAGLLHDIGKIGIPESILGKHGRLTYEEYEIMKSHVVKSIQMIHFLPNMSDIIPAVVSHHERYDGKGYPRGLKGEEIPVLGRILTICDCYDAMVSKRPYKAELPVEYAVDELHKHSGTQFDADMVKVFVSLIDAGRIKK